MNEKITFNCIVCGTEKTVYKSCQTGKYCSIGCVGIDRKGKSQIRSLEGKISFKKKTSGKNNHAWKGDKAGYITIHHWVERYLGKSLTCVKCGITVSNGNKIVWANKSGQYKRDLTDWLRLCKKCHHLYDDIYTRGWNTRRRYT